MGYTHYFQHKKNIKNDVWNKICDDVEKIISYCQNNGINLASNMENSTNMVHKKLGIINFNGVGDDEHETFDIFKKPIINDDFTFCKTAQKPYDLAVCSTLLIVHYHAPNHYHIRSDGDAIDWKEASELNFELFQYGFKLPKDIIDNNPNENKEIQANFQNIIDIHNSKEHLEETLLPKTNTNKIRVI